MCVFKGRTSISERTTTCRAKSKSRRGRRARVVKGCFWLLNACKAPLGHVYTKNIQKITRGKRVTVIYSFCALTTIGQWRAVFTIKEENPCSADCTQLRVRTDANLAVSPANNHNAQKCIGSTVFRIRRRRTVFFGFLVFFSFITIFGVFE